MVGTEHSIVGLVYAAKTDSEAADTLISQYMGFIRSETVKFTRAARPDGHEDELSIAMLAFYEAILGYERTRGAFLPYAARAIRNRLIDHYRTEKRHGNVISLHAPAGDEEDRTLMDTLPDARDEIGDYEARSASQQEIREFAETLSRCGRQLPPAGADAGRMPPGAGFCPVPAGSARSGGGHGKAAHGRAGGRLRRREEDSGTASEIPGGNPAGLHQRL